MHPFLIESLTAARIADLHDGAARRRLARAATGREARGVRRTPVPRGLSSAPTGTAVAACC